MRSGEVIEACARGFGEGPREISPRDLRTYFAIPRPPWLKYGPGDAIATLIREAPSIFRHGFVTWAHIIQANRLLYEPGP